MSVNINHSTSTTGMLAISINLPDISHYQFQYLLRTFKLCTSVCICNKNCNECERKFSNGNNKFLMFTLQARLSDLCLICYRSLDNSNASDILSTLRQNVTGGNANNFNISRSRIWEGIRRAILRSSFSPTRPISVKFTDDIGLAEGAVDEGGPRRELLQLAIEYLRNTSCLFTGPSGCKHLNPLQHGRCL